MMQRENSVTSIKSESAAVSALNLEELESLTAGNAIRHKIFNMLTPILLGSEQVNDAATKVMIQACCRQMVSQIEGLIELYGLDAQSRDQNGSKL